MNANMSDSDNEKFDSWIAHNTTYIDETKQILNEYVEHQSYQTLKKRVQEDNLLNKRQRLSA